MEDRQACSKRRSERGQEVEDGVDVRSEVGNERSCRSTGVIGVL